MIDRHAVVTGGGTGIGSAISTALAEKGARVTVMGRRHAPLTALAEAYPGIHAITCDVTDPEEFLKLAREQKMEGYLFPSTYRFKKNTSPQEVINLLKSEFINTTSDVSIATSVPPPIAIPISAAARAGASLMPSPTIATTLPCSFNS